MIQLNYLQNRKRQKMNVLPGGSMAAGAGRGKDIQEVQDRHVNTAISRIDNRQGRTVQYMALYSMLVAAQTGGESGGRMDSGVHLAESFCCLPEVNTSVVANQLCIRSCSAVSDSDPMDCSPLSMGFSRQEYQSGQPLPSSGDLLNPGIDPWSLASQADFLSSELPGKTLIYYTPIKSFLKKTIQTNKKEKTKIKQPYQKIEQKCN